MGDIRTRAFEILRRMTGATEGTILIKDEGGKVKKTVKFVLSGDGTIQLKESPLY